MKMRALSKGKYRTEGLGFRMLDPLCKSKNKTYYELEDSDWVYLGFPTLFCNGSVWNKRFGVASFRPISHHHSCNAYRDSFQLSKRQVPYYSGTCARCLVSCQQSEQ